MFVCRRKFSPLITSLRACIEYSSEFTWYDDKSSRNVMKWVHFPELNTWVVTLTFSVVSDAVAVVAT